MPSGLDDVVALARERAEAAGAARRLDDDLVAQLSATGPNRSLLPAGLGGTEAHPADVMDVVATVAAADGSAGWCAAIGVGSNLFAGYMPEDMARRTFVEPDAGSAGVFAPAGVATMSSDGATARLTGRWPFASNCVHSRWVGLGAWVESEDGGREPVPRLVFVDRDDLAIEDTWDGAGLRATSSHHVRADGIRIDIDRSCTFEATPWAEGTLWRMPLFTVLAPVLTAAPLGIARGAVDELLGKVMAGTGGAMRGSLVDDPVGLADLGEADATLRAAEAGVVHAVNEVWNVAAAAEPVSRMLQARVSLAVSHAVDVAVASTSTAHRLSGGAAAFAGHRVLAALRDVETARQHALFSHQHRPLLTRIVAGSDEVAQPFVV